jgi:hypothetical protein
MQINRNENRGYEKKIEAFYLRWDETTDKNREYSQNFIQAAVEMALNLNDDGVTTYEVNQ